MKAKIETALEFLIETGIPAAKKAIARAREWVGRLEPVWLTYFPFVGWLYPFIAMKDDAFAMHHGKQAFIMAVAFTAAPIILTFSTVFIPISFRGLKLTVVIMVYLSHLAYFALCAWGFVKMRAGEKYDFPVVSDYAKRLNV